MLHKLLVISAYCLSLVLTGCAVYVPTVPSTPLISEGQVEVSAGMRGLTSQEVGAAWSPRPHLLLTAESGFQESDGSYTVNNETTTYHDYHRQLSLGIGYYQAPTEYSHWYWAVVAGAGYAGTSLHAVDVGIVSPWIPVPLPSVAGHYEAQYWRGYLQAYAACPLGPVVTGGVSVRSTVVSYTNFTYEGQEVSPTNHGFIEPTLFMRLGHGVVQGQGTLGLSLPTSGDANSPFNKRTAPVSGLVSFSVIFRPDKLWHRSE